MTKAKSEKITVGSGYAYLIPYAEEIPTVEEICVDENLLGYTKGGAALEYTDEIHEEKDDLGHVYKIITTNEELIFKLGLLTWDGNTLPYMIDRCKSEVKDGKRITKIGGAGNAQGKYYVLCFHHPDAQAGDLWVMIVGRNTAGATLTFAMDEGTKLEPEFKALPLLDEDGTLAMLYEEIPAA